MRFADIRILQRTPNTREQGREQDLGNKHQLRIENKYLKTESKLETHLRHCWKSLLTTTNCNRSKNLCIWLELSQKLGIVPGIVKTTRQRICKAFSDVHRLHTQFGSQKTSRKKKKQQQQKQQQKQQQRHQQQLQI